MRITTTVNIYIITHDDVNSMINTVFDSKIWFVLFDIIFKNGFTWKDVGYHQSIKITTCTGMKYNGNITGGHTHSIHLSQSHNFYIKYNLL